LLASSRGENAYRIARSLGCNPQTARNAIHEFNEGGLKAALSRGSSRPHTVHAAFDSESAERLREILHRDPREFGKHTSLTEGRVSGETIRATLARLGVRWERAKRWIESPDPEYARKKGHVIG
jgi:transposase